MDSQSLVQDYIARQDTGGSILSRSDNTVPVAWTERSLHLCVLTQGETLCQMREETLGQNMTGLDGISCSKKETFTGESFRRQISLDDESTPQN